MMILQYYIIEKKKFPGVSAGLDRSPLDQALTQLAALGITLAFALIGGWLTGTYHMHAYKICSSLIYNF